MAEENSTYEVNSETVDSNSIESVLPPVTSTQVAISSNGIITQAQPHSNHVKSIKQKSFQISPLPHKYSPSHHANMSKYSNGIDAAKPFLSDVQLDYQSRQSRRNCVYPPHRQVEHDRLMQKARVAVEALRIRGANFTESFQETIEVMDANEDGISRPYVSIPEDVFDALDEFMNNSSEQTLVYQALQPLVGMVFGKHGSAANNLHALGATLELSDGRFRVRCPRNKAVEVQEEFEKKLAYALVRLNMENSTVVMRPEKLMVMLSPFTLTPVVVIGLLTPQLMAVRIYDNEEERRFNVVNNDMQRFYSHLSRTTQLKDYRLSLPITIGTLACYCDPQSNVYMRVVVEELMETIEEDRGPSSNPCSVWARIWKMDYGSYSTVHVEDLYRLQSCYLQVRRQCIICRLLYAKKKNTCLLSTHQIYREYFRDKTLYALSVMENPCNLSHVILLHRENSISVSGDRPAHEPVSLGELADLMGILLAHNIYEVAAYPGGENFTAKLDSVQSFPNSVKYSQFYRQSNSTSTPTTVASDDASSSNLEEIGIQPNEALLELVCPYRKNPDKRFVSKQNGIVLSNVEKTLQRSNEHTSIALPESAAIHGHSQNTDHFGEATLHMLAGGSAVSVPSGAALWNGMETYSIPAFLPSAHPPSSIVTASGYNVSLISPAGEVYYPSSRSPLVTNYANAVGSKISTDDATQSHVNEDSGDA